MSPLSGFEHARVETAPWIIARAHTRAPPPTHTSALGPALCVGRPPPQPRLHHPPTRPPTHPLVRHELQRPDKGRQLHLVTAGRFGLLSGAAAAAKAAARGLHALPHRLWRQPRPGHQPVLARHLQQLPRQHARGGAPGAVREADVPQQYRNVLVVQRAQACAARPQRGGPRGAGWVRGGAAINGVPQSVARGGMEVGLELPAGAVQLRPGHRHTHPAAAWWSCACVSSPCSPPPNLTPRRKARARHHPAARPTYPWPGRTRHAAAAARQPPCGARCRNPGEAQQQASPAQAHTADRGRAELQEPPRGQQPHAQGPRPKGSRRQRVGPIRAPALHASCWCMRVLGPWHHD